jgi:hypothetical protein
MDRRMFLALSGVSVLELLPAEAATSITLPKARDGETLAALIHRAKYQAVLTFAPRRGQNYLIQIKRGHKVVLRGELFEAPPSDPDAQPRPGLPGIKYQTSGPTGWEDMDDAFEDVVLERGQRVRLIVVGYDPAFAG